MFKYGVFVPGSRGAHHNRTAKRETASRDRTQAAMQVKHLLLIAIFALTAACSSNETISENLGETELYRQAQADLDNKSYNSAISKLKALESRYPFGRYAEQAQL